MDIYDEDLVNLWKSLNKADVKYIMVGGFATNLHGYYRTTGDVDIWIEDTIVNRKNLRRAFNLLNLGDFEAFETIEFIPGWSSIYLDSGIELDIMTKISGFGSETFMECYQLSPIAEINGVQVKFLHINHLIESKRLSDRPKDRNDIIELEKIRERRNSVGN